MANNTLFAKVAGLFLPKADTVNEAGGNAYRFEPKHALAQLAATGCFNNTFYAAAEQQLDQVIQTARMLDPEFVAKTAIYARQRGAMKDAPALLTAEVASRAPALLTKIFPRVIDSPKMLRNFVQILRSGAVGRRSLGTVPKQMVRQFLAQKSDEDLFAGAVGQQPSLADVIKMVHPKPETATRRALYGYLLGRNHEVAELPEVVRAFEAYKVDRSLPVPEVAFQYLTALDLGQEEWAAIARRASWTMTRMNLQTFKRHGVFEVKGLVDLIAARLRDPEQIRRARALPHQLFAAAMAAADLPKPIRQALSDATEVAIENLPELKGQVHVLLDVSGSMASAATGARQGATSTVRCVDVAGLITAAILRRATLGQVVPFNDAVVYARIGRRDTILDNAKKLAGLLGGGTNCSAPLRWLNDHRAEGDLVIMVSDNQSWIDTKVQGNMATETLKQWQIYKDRNRAAKLICIDLQPYASTQACERTDIINVGGFSDDVFRLIGEVARGQGGGLWVQEIEAIEI